MLISVRRSTRNQHSLPYRSVEAQSMGWQSVCFRSPCFNHCQQPGQPGLVWCAACGFCAPAFSLNGCGIMRATFCPPVPTLEKKR
eukprot:1160781-Pelagomonas_calceolata.AAC.11